jgi:uncharacterized phage protein (TIGR02220 family)
MLNIQTMNNRVWLKYYIGMAKDNKFEELRLEHGINGSVYIDIFMIIWAASAQYNGVFQKSDGVPHDKLSLRVLFMAMLSYLTEDMLEECFQALESKRLIDRKDNGIITITNFAKYQVVNSTERTKDYRERQKRDGLITQAIHEFNAITGKKFSTKTEETRHAINARFAEGHTLEVMKKVIRLKYEEWKDTPKMQKYITPRTMFRPSNFDRYANEIPDGFSTAERFNVKDAFGNRMSVTQEEFDAAEKGFLTKI